MVSFGSLSPLALTNSLAAVTARSATGSCATAGDATASASHTAAGTNRLISASSLIRATLLAFFLWFIASNAAWIPWGVKQPASPDHSLIAGGPLNGAGEPCHRASPLLAQGRTLKAEYGPSRRRAPDRIAWDGGRSRRRRQKAHPASARRARGMREVAPHPGGSGGGAGQGRLFADVPAACDGWPRARTARCLSRHRGDLQRKRLHRLVHHDRHGRIQLHGLARC